MADEKKPAGPDLTRGVPFSSIADGGFLLGHVGGEAVLLVRQGAEAFAIGPECTHYHGPLAEGVVTDGAVRCPWHHACFDLRTGEALHAPALSPVACWKVERQGDTITVREKMEQPKPRPRGKASAMPDSIVIVGGGAAGFAAAEMLRRQGYQNAITMLSSDDAPPVDRPNLSKDYLAGSAPEDWLPLRPDDFYKENNIDLWLNTEVGRIDVKDSAVKLKDGSQRPLRPPAACDRRRAGAPSHSGCGPAACAHAALARRLPRDHQGRRWRQARGGDRRELHRPRSRGLVTRAQARGARGGAREASARTRVRAADGRLHPQPARGAWRGLPSGRHAPRHHRKPSEAEEWRHARRRPRGRRCRRASAHRARGSCGPRDRPRRDSRRLSADQRAEYLRGGRHRALARPAHRRKHPGRALGGRRSGRVRPRR